MTVYIIYLYPIPRDRSSYTLKLEKSVIIIYTCQNFKLLHRAVGSLVNPHYGGLVITSWRICSSKCTVKRQRFIFSHPVTVSVVHTKPGFKCHYLIFFQPGCIYRVRVKTGDSNPHIERASPSFIDIQVMGVREKIFLCTAYR